MILLAIGGVARADRDPAFTELEHQLPSGWSMLRTENDLVLRHDGPVYRVGATAAVVTLELRYHVQPQWTESQLASARGANERIAAELREQKAKLAPAAYEKAAAQAAARMVKLPLCTLGLSSLFDGDETYAQLSLKLDPPSAHTEAQRIADLVRHQCHA